MEQRVTVIIPIKLATGTTEAALLAGSEQFQKEFVDHQPGVMRRELIRTGEGQYMDIVQFRSEAAMGKVIEEEATSPVCQKFFSLMDLSESEGNIRPYPSLATYS